MSCFYRRATGGPEVAMGTGPWPQPPTEAEQLQALMAAANGESNTSPSFLLFPPSSLLSFSLQMYLSLCASGCVGRGVVCSFQGNQPDSPIDKALSVHIDVSIL